MKRVLPKLIGLLLLALVVHLVGWSDRVEGTDGDIVHGRVERVGEDIAVVDGRRVGIAGPRAVRYGLRRAFAALAAAPGDTALGVLCLLGSALAIVWRWGVLVRGTGLDTAPKEILRLGWLGMFFNQVLPAGQVGGDVVKAVALARAQPERRGLAVSTVLADRGLGWFVLAVVAAAGVGAAPAGSRMALAATVIWVSLTICAVFMTILMLPRLRRRFPPSRLLAWLPGKRAWDGLANGFHRIGCEPLVIARATAVGFVVHALFLLSFVFFGRALDAPLSLFAVLAAIPVAQMAGTIPGLPAGWGVGDMAFWFFLPAAGVEPHKAVVLSFTFRATFMLLSLPGALLLRAEDATGAQRLT